MKKCTKCGEVKSLDDFSMCKRAKDGKRSHCKQCRLNTQKKYREENPEKVAASNKKWQQKNKEKIAVYNKKYNKKYREENPEKVAAHSKKWQQENPERAATSSRKWNQKNKEKMAEQRKQYEQKNKEKIAARKKKYREENPEYKEKIAARTKKYREENKELHRLYSQRRLARKKALPNTLTPQQWNLVLEHFNGGCALTKQTENIHLEHFIPISWGHGGTTHKNCYPMVDRLNYSKHDLNPFIWIKRFPQYKESFKELVKYLAEQNEMSEKEFEDYVYWCDNKRIDMEKQKGGEVIKSEQR